MPVLFEVGAEELENATNTREKHTAAQKLTPNPTPLSFNDAGVKALRIWLPFENVETTGSLSPHIDKTIVA